MTSNEFVDYLGLILEPSQAFENLLRLLASVSEQQPTIRDCMRGVIAERNMGGIAAPHNNLTTSLNQLTQTILQDFETRQVWAGVEDLTKRAEAIAATVFGKAVGE